MTTDLNPRPPRIVLLGPNGQLGWELQRALAPLGTLQLLDRAAGGDLERPDALVQAVRALQPDIVVNAAAHTAVDKAESEPDRARLINADAPAALAADAARHGSLLLHYSTDYVFDGSGQHARTEDEPTGPLNTYGRSKLQGEDAIRASGCRHLIFRTSWVFAARGGNFARTMLRLAGERPRLTVVDDQHGAPTGADLLADASAHALRRALVDTAVDGTYHVCASGHTTWCAYARHVVGWAQQHGLPLQAGPDQIDAVPSSAFATPARRPLNSRLDTSKFSRTFGLVLPAWQTGVERMLAEAIGPTLPRPSA